MAHYTDVSSQESVDGAIAEIIVRHGKIDSFCDISRFHQELRRNQLSHRPSTEVVMRRCRWGVLSITVAKHLMERKALESMVFIGSTSDSMSTYRNLKRHMTLPRQLFDIWPSVWWSNGLILIFVLTACPQATCSRRCKSIYQY